MDELTQARAHVAALVQESLYSYDDEYEICCLHCGVCIPGRNGSSGSPHLPLLPISSDGITDYAALEQIFPHADNCPVIVARAWLGKQAHE